MKMSFERRSLTTVALIGLLLLGAYLFCLRGPPAGREKANDAKDLAVVGEIVESLIRLQNQLKVCQDGKARYLAHPDPAAIAKGQKDTEVLFDMLSKESLWLAGLEQEADKRWTNTTRLTIKRFREIAAEWRDEAAKIEEKGKVLKTFWLEEKAKKQ
jgi:hypothetical protein